jgi:hypothetical protein
MTRLLPKFPCTVYLDYGVWNPIYQKDRNCNSSQLTGVSLSSSLMPVRPPARPRPARRCAHHITHATHGRRRASTRPTSQHMLAARPWRHSTHCTGRRSVPLPGCLMLRGARRVPPTPSLTAALAGGRQGVSCPGKGPATSQ